MATATFRNKRTGETRDFTLEEAMGVGISQESFLSKLETQKGIEEIQRPGGKDPLAVQKRVALEAVDILKKRFGRGSAEDVGTRQDLSLAGEGAFGSRLGGQIKGVASSLFDPRLREDINIFKASLGNFVGVFTQAFGSGTPQAAEAARLLKDAPGPKTTDREAKAWFDDVTSLLGGEITEEPPSLGGAGVEGLSQEPPGLDISDQMRTLFPVLNLVQIDKTISDISNLFPGTKKLLETRQMEIKEGGLENARVQTLQTLFPALQLITPEGRGAGLELGLLIFGPELFKRGLKVAGKVFRPFKTVGDIRAAKVAEAQGRTISGDKILKEIKNVQKTISPTQQKSFSRFFEAAEELYKGRNISVADAVKLNTEANKAYTAAGKVGKSAIASFNKAMGDSIKTQLGIVAPDIAKANKLFSLLFKGQKIFKRFAPPALGAGIIGKGISGLNLK